MEDKEKLIEDLQYIKQIVSDSRNVVVDNGKGFILWGILIILGLIGSYVDALASGYQYSGEIWIGLVLLGWIFSYAQWYRHRGRVKKVTFAGKIMSATWLSAGVAMTIVGFVGSLSGAYHGVYISPIIASILGIAFYLTAKVTDSKLLLYAAPAWWAGSIYMFLFPGISTLLIMACLMLILQVTPGILFYKKYKSDHGNDGREF